MLKHASLTLIGLVLGALLVFWIRPETDGGTAFLVVVGMLFSNVVGAICMRLLPSGGGARRLQSKPAPQDAMLGE